MAKEEEIVEQPVEGETTPAEPKKKKNSTWKYVLNIFLVLIISGVAVFLAVRKNFNTIVHYLVTSDYRFLLIILALMVVYIAIRSFIYFAFARLFTRDYHYHQSVAVEFIGTFYAAVTPGGQGGEVMQAYTYKKQGIPISSAVSALAMHSIIYQIILIVFGLTSFIVKYDFIQSLPNANLGTYGDFTLLVPMWVLTLLGFGLNIGYIGMVLMMGYWKGFHRFIMGPIITLLHKIRIVKNPDKSRENLRVQIENFKIEIRRLFSNIPFTILVSICYIASLTIRFSIPYFVGLAMHNQSTCASFWDSIFLGNYHQMATGLIPIPGSAGISEFVFNTLYSTSPALPNTSFFYVSANLDSVKNYYDLIISNPNKYDPFFKKIAPYIAAYPDENSISKYIYETIITDSGTLAYEECSDAFKRVVQFYADTQESSAMASAALVMWRSITFTLPLIVAGFVTAFYRASPKEEARGNDNVASRQTLVDLRRETYDERVQMAETMIETSRLTRESIAKRLKALARSDRRERRRKKKEQERLEREQQQDSTYTDVTIKDEDDSL